MNTIYTIGYEDHTPDSFVHKLLDHKIEILVDVRQRAGSRKRGFAKTALSDLITAHGIQYQHRREVGTPADLRKQFRAGTVKLDVYLAAYRTHLGDQGDSVDELLKLVQEHRCCLMCQEAVPETCHRSVLASLLVKRGGQGVNIVHL